MRYTQDEYCCISMQVEGVSHRPAIWNMSDRCCLFVYRDTLRCMTAEISWRSDINRTFFDGQDVWWCLYQKLPGILPETDAKNHVMSYGYPNSTHYIDSEKADFAWFKMIKRTNLDIKDTACLHIVHILKDWTSRPTMKSTQSTMVKAPIKNVSPLPTGHYG